MDAAPPDQQAAEVRQVDTCQRRGTLSNPLPNRCLPPIDTDRPHRTDTPATVPAGHVQGELGLVTYETAGPQSPATMHFFDALLKLGVSEDVDAQVGYSPVALRQRGDRAGWFGGAHVATGQTIYLRSKIRVAGDHHSAAALTLAPVVVVPVAKDPLVEGGGTLMLGVEFTKWLSWEFNSSIFWERQEGTDMRLAHFVPCTALTTDLVGPLKLFGEIYLERPLEPAEKWSGTVDTGLLLSLSRDVQLDAGVYRALRSTLAPYATFAGASARW